jgi:hypothetical protein
MDNKKLESQIRKTGFVLENGIAQTLKPAGWTVISNKYYVDDFENTVREIDLVAYQVKTVHHLEVYTVLMISCKKTESNVWALLARDINLRDPNSDWWPLHAWTNDKALQFQLAEPGAAKRFHESAITNGVDEVLKDPSVEVFAFQEMDRTSGSPQNDKPIFTAVTSLMKAQAYELDALPLRKKAPCVYQFNLLSIVDAEMARLMFQGGRITCTPLDTEHYLARYIVKRKETFSRIRFIRASAFAKALEDYGRLHHANAAWFDGPYRKFYDGILSDYRRSDVFREDFQREIVPILQMRLSQALKSDTKPNTRWFTWDKTKSEVALDFFQDQAVNDFLNKDPATQKKVKAALQHFYHYSGAFRFDVSDEVPF